MTIFIYCDKMLMHKIVNVLSNKVTRPTASNFKTWNAFSYTTREDGLVVAASHEVFSCIV